jgi:integrase/recombinase XerD
MRKRQTASRLARAIDRFLTHKRTLGHHYRQESWLLQRLECFVTESGRRELDAKCFARWLMSLQDRHPNTRRKWHQTCATSAAIGVAASPAASFPRPMASPDPSPT